MRRNLNKFADSHRLLGVLAKMPSDLNRVNRPNWSRQTRVICSVGE
jgi:hypothetical protein